MLIIIERLEAKAETNILDSNESVTLNEANLKLAILRRDEEAKWEQRAKVKHIQEGGNNTKYFHMIAHGKHRKKRIFQLEQDDGIIVGQQNLKVYITEFYKKLFGAPEENFFSLDETVAQDISKLSDEENDILKADFIEKEIHDAIF